MTPKLNPKVFWVAVVVTVNVIDVRTMDLGDFGIWIAAQTWITGWVWPMCKLVLTVAGIYKFLR